jgi:hypothetical protein
MSLLSLLCLHQSFDNGFQRRTFPSLRVPELSPISCLYLGTDRVENTVTVIVSNCCRGDMIVCGTVT